MVVKATSICCDTRRACLSGSGGRIDGENPFSPLAKETLLGWNNSHGYLDIGSLLCALPHQPLLQHGSGNFFGIFSLMI